MTGIVVFKFFELIMNTFLVLCISGYLFLFNFHFVQSICCPLPYTKEVSCNLFIPMDTYNRDFDLNDDLMPSPNSQKTYTITRDSNTGSCYRKFCGSDIFDEHSEYCSTGSCNMFGCNCSGDCIGSNFLRLQDSSLSVEISIPNSKKKFRSRNWHNADEASGSKSSEEEEGFSLW